MSLSEAELKAGSLLTAFLTLVIRYVVGRLVVVAPGLRILPELFGICRCKLLISFRIRGA